MFLVMRKSAPPPPDSPAGRLRAARIAAKYETARAAAEAMGIREQTYNNHENGTAGLARSGERYARFFRVSLEWLLTGRGEMKPARKDVRKIPVDGLVGAGAAVEKIDDAASWEAGRETVDIPGDDEVRGLVVRGDSQYPRFLDGEVVLFDPRPATLDTLIGQYAIVQTDDGRRLIKILRRGIGGKWRLESHNAPPEEVDLLGAWRYLGVMTPA
jgi:phage repressor protein C with HTH and peptisase S24 domain